MPHQPPPQISSPLRILVLSPPSTPVPPILKDPTLALSTPYYSANIPVWHDALPTSGPELRQWEGEWRGEEAGEVVRAVGAWAVCFLKPLEVEGGGDRVVSISHIGALLTAISALLSHHHHFTTTSSPYLPMPDPPLLLAIGLHQPLSPRLELPDADWEDLLRECGGWEWVDGEVSGEEGKGKEARNEFGEKIGLARLHEALCANEWSANADSDISDLDSLLAQHDHDADADVEFAFEAGSADGAMRMGLMEKVGGGGEDDDRRGGEGDGDGGVEELEAMMSKMLAVRNLGQDMPEAERRRFAARAVRDVMLSS